MFSLRKRRHDVIIDGNSISGNSIDKILADCLDEYDKEYCLDVVVGHDDGSKFTTVDIAPDVGADIVGDIRCLFAASDMYRKQRASCPDLSKIRPGHFMVVRLKHVVEHVEWIYQEGLFEWVYGVLANGGIVVIDTPNLDYICRIYVSNRQRQLDEKVLRYPGKEYGSGLDTGRPENLQKWVNFKLYSGCSPGDYHHACLNMTLLYYLLSRVGFVDIGISDTETLRAVAFKAANSDEDLLEVINRELGDE